MTNHAIEIGELLLGRYQIEARAGEGAFGAVFRARDQDTGELVAIKALPAERQLTETTVARFRREMKIISALMHRNIIGLYDYGQTRRGELFMVLEYVDGAPMDSAVKRGPLSADKVISIAEQICAALQLAHHRGVIHRDLKPANIMLVEQGGDYLVKVLDFGTAKLLQQLDDEPVMELTREGMAVGTPRYIAPEQARGEQIGPWSDLYALGLLLYELLTGARAVKYDDVEGAVLAHISDEPLPLPELETVPRAFHPVLRQLMHKDPRRRYRSADEVLGDLEALRLELVEGLGGAGGRMDPVRAAVVFPHEQQSDGPEDERESSAEPGIAAYSSEAKKRAHAKQVLEQARQPSSLELDWGDHPRVETSAEPSGVPRRKPAADQPLRRVWFQPPRQAGEWAEALLSPLFGFLGFIFLGAQLFEVSYLPRVLLALSPAGVALIWSILTKRVSWRYSFFRLWILFSLAAVVLAHALGPRRLINELFRGTAWFLVPIQDLPGVETFEAALGWLLRRYATLLSTVLEAISEFLV